MAPAPFAADLETQARRLHVKLQGELSDAPIVGYGTCSKSKTSTLLVGPAINCRIRSLLHYKSLTPPPARRKAANPMLIGEKGKIPKNRLDSNALETR
jgi:hypothetical protein